MFDYLAVQLHCNDGVTGRNCLNMLFLQKQTVINLGYHCIVFKPPFKELSLIQITQMIENN